MDHAGSVGYGRVKLFNTLGGHDERICFLLGLNDSETNDDALLYSGREYSSWTWHPRSSYKLSPIWLTAAFSPGAAVELLGNS